MFVAWREQIERDKERENVCSLWYEIIGYEIPPAPSISLCFVALWNQVVVPYVALASQCMIWNLEFCLHWIFENKTAHLPFMILWHAQPGNYVCAAQKSSKAYFKLSMMKVGRSRGKSYQVSRLFQRKWTFFVQKNPNSAKEQRFANAGSSLLNCEHFIEI